MKSNDEIKRHIMKNYSTIAKNGSAGGCCSGSCSCSGTPIKISESTIKIGYSEADLASVPEEANMGLGCGNPLAIAALQKGESVLDLGSGGGFDCFLARKQVGEDGHVIGVDMTVDMIMLARKNAQKLGYNNVEFRLGEIEHLPIADSTVDVIISNCVINLALDKESVFSEAYRVLKPGGRVSVSDVVAIEELPDQIKDDLTMFSGCIAGAEHVDHIRTMMQKSGFKNIVLKPKDNSREIVQSWAPDSNIGDYVASYIIEATK